MRISSDILDLTFVNQDNQKSVEPCRVIRLINDVGNEEVWEMHGFMEEMVQPLRFRTKEEYMEHVKQWDEFFEFPSWEAISTPEKGAELLPYSNDMMAQEIHQWLYDIVCKMWSSYQHKYTFIEKVQVDSLSFDLDGVQIPKTTIGIEVGVPNSILNVLFIPEWPDFEDPLEGAGWALGTYQQIKHKWIPVYLLIPIVWNITQNKPNVFKRGDKCRVRFVAAMRESDYNHPERMSSWKDMPYSQVWDLLPWNTKSLEF